MQPTVVQAFIAAMGGAMLAANCLRRDKRPVGTGQDPRIKEWFRNLTQGPSAGTHAAGDRRRL